MIIYWPSVRYCDKMSFFFKFNAVETFKILKKKVCVKNEMKGIQSQAIYKTYSYIPVVITM